MMRTPLLVVLVIVGVLTVAIAVGALLPGGAGSTRAEPTASSVVPVAPTVTSAPPAEPPGSPTVQFSEASAEHPAARRIRALLQTYFDALNLGDYRRWTTTVIGERAEATPERLWRDRRADTEYGSILVRRLTPRLGGGYVALVSFTSVRDPAGNPSRCVRWRVSSPVVLAEFGQLRLARDEPGSTVRDSCRPAG